jgi:C-5 cytosine-specific DNA methylase
VMHQTNGQFTSGGNVLNRSCPTIKIRPADLSVQTDGQPEPPRQAVPDKPLYRVPSMIEVAALPWNGFKVASTFSGCGGSCLGYRMAGFKVVWANEFVPAAQESYGGWSNSGRPHGLNGPFGRVKGKQWLHPRRAACQTQSDHAARSVGAKPKGRRGRAYHRPAVGIWRPAMTGKNRDPALPSPSDPLFVLELSSEVYGTYEFTYYSLDEMLAGAGDLFDRASREWEHDRVERRISLVVGTEGWVVPLSTEGSPKKGTKNQNRQRNNTMPAPKTPDHSSGKTTTQAAPKANERKPWKKKSPGEIVLEQAEKLKAEIAEAEEDIKAKRRQLEKFEQARKLFEAT